VDNKIFKIIEPLLGKNFSEIWIDSYKCLRLGFGEKKFHNNPKIEKKYFTEWEIGSYRSSWRIVKDNKILMGKNDLEDVKELNIKINNIEFGNILAIKQISHFDIRLEFQDHILIEYLPAFSDVDEFFYIFCPENIHLEFAQDGKWTISKSNEPFSRNL
jgi:hypothetical protein